MSSLRRGGFIFRVLVGPLHLLARISFIDFGKAMSLTALLVKRLKIEGALHNPNGVKSRFTQPVGLHYLCILAGVDV